MILFSVFYILYFQSRVSQEEYVRYETPVCEPDIPTQNGGISPHFVNRLRREGATPTAADNCEHQFMKVLRKVYQTIERNEMRLQEQDRKDILKQEWQQLALVMDRMLLLIFVIFTTTMALVVLVPKNYADRMAADGV